MWGIGQNLGPPAIERQGALDETMAQGGCHFGLVVGVCPGMIAKNAKLSAIESLEPSFDRKLPVGMVPEKSANNTDAHRLARGRSRGRHNRWIVLRNDPADERAINSLEVAVVRPLIGEIKWLARTYAFCELRLTDAGLLRIAQCSKPFLISGAPRNNFGLLNV
jgi:hypothetical protein